MVTVVVSQNPRNHVVAPLDNQTMASEEGVNKSSHLWQTLIVCDINIYICM